MNEVVKYPRTPHLPWSEGITSDDKVIESLDAFDGRRVVVTEKMDGENITMYRNYIHARSSSPLSNRKDRDYIKKLHAEIRSKIGARGKLDWGTRICGEYLFAKHSIFYDDLDSYFELFGIADDLGWGHWAEVERSAEVLGLKTVPVIYKGSFDRGVIEKAFGEYCKNKSREVEGYVVRLEYSFPLADFGKCVAKWVRKNHVQTDEHWTTKKMVKNSLAKIA